MKIEQGKRWWLKRIKRFAVGLVGAIFVTVYAPGLIHSQIFAPDKLSTSPPVPVGSGARALGMGGAFIAVADDATAASWNPGGLGQLQRPEISIAGSYFSRDERYNNAVTEKEKGRVSSEDLNYFSIAYAGNILKRNLFFSLNYQRLFDFGRKIKLNYTVENTTDCLQFEQEGSLYTFSPAMAIEVTPGLYAGFVYNNWSNYMTGKSNWESKINNTITMSTLEGKIESEVRGDFKNFNAESWAFGFLYKITPDFKIGGVYKTPFKARVKCNYEINEYDTLTSGNPEPELSISGETSYKVDFPSAYGLGFSYQIGEPWTISWDITRTEWQNYFVYNNLGQKVGPFGKTTENETIDVPQKEPTYTIRLGIEYLKMMKKIDIPFRFGIFYDPEPSIESPQDFYGVSIGCGLVVPDKARIFDRLQLDFAYTYRFGNEVSIQESGISEVFDEIKSKISQHFLLSSLIFYF